MVQQVYTVSSFIRGAQNCLSDTYAAQELVYELSEYLSRRYPDTYSVDRHPPRSDDFGWYGEGQIKRITITPLGASYDLDIEDPMAVSSLL